LHGSLAGSIKRRANFVERILQLAGNRRITKRTKTEIYFDVDIIDRLKPA